MSSRSVRITDCSDEDILMELIERNKVNPAPNKKQFNTPHSEIIIGIGNDDVAYIQLDNESLKTLKTLT